MTTAKRLGHVRQGTGLSATTGANTVEISAQGYDLATSVFDTATGGVINVGHDTASHARVGPTIEGQLGDSGSQIIASSTVHVVAASITDADATTRSASGGAINIQNFGATAHTEPHINVSVGADADITAPTVTIEATHNTTPPQFSDGTFTAGSGTVDTSNGITGNSITFAADHGLNTGQFVTYLQQSGGLIGGLQNGRRYGVIVPVGTGHDTRTLQLGTAFAGASVDQTTDTIVFGGAHGLVEGDSVYYFPPPGSAAVAGLVLGTLYRVHVVDGRHVKLVLPADYCAACTVHVPTATVTTGTSITTDGSGHGIVNATNTFGTDQPVTYRAPAPVYSFTAAAVNLKSSGGTPTLDSNNHLQWDETQETIFVGTGEPDPNTHAFTTHLTFANGEAFTYHTSNSTTIGPGIHDGQTLYVINTSDAFKIKVAASYCDAVGSAGDAACFDPDGPDAGTAPDPHAVAPLDLTRDSTAAGVRANHTLSRTSEAPLTGLVDGGVYYVRNQTGSTFQLALAPSGTPIDITSGSRTGAIGTHTFAAEGVNITAAGSGLQYLIVDLTSTGSGAQKLDGVGGSSVLAGAPTGDQVATASSSGSSGGAIDVKSANANAVVHPILTNTIGSGASIHAGTINITTDNRGLVGANTSSGGGGLVSVGDADAHTSDTTDTTITIDTGAQLIATGNVVVNAGATLRSSVDAAGSGGGLFSGVHSSAASDDMHTTKTVVKGTVTAGGDVTIGATTSISGTANADSNANGLGADSDATASIVVSSAAVTRTEIWDAARISGNNVVIDAIVSGAFLHTDGEAESNAGGADSDGTGRSNLAGTTEVRIKAKDGSLGDQIVGNDSVELRSEYRNVDLRALSDAACHCFAGAATSRSDADVSTLSLVSGEDESFLKTASLRVIANAFVTHYDKPRDAHGGAFVDHNEPSGGSNAPDRRIYWESTTTLLGEPNPVLTIDSSGQITEKTKNVQVRYYDPVAHTFSFLLRVGDPVPAGMWIVVGDLLYDQGGDVTFSANDTSPNSLIYGNAGEFKVKDTWDSVTITNYSDRKLVTNDINTATTANPPKITVSVDTVPGPITGAGTPADDVHLAEGTFTTFEFKISHVFAKTEVQIQNLSGTTTPSDIVLDGRIENIIGHTLIKNVRGNILSDNANDLDGIESTGVDSSFVAIFARPGADTDTELIRTNKLELHAPAGSIGKQSDSGPDFTRIPIAAEGIRFLDEASTLFDIVVQAEAQGDLVLDLTANERSLASAATTIAVQVDYLHAGDDLDVVIHDSVQGTNAGSGGNVHVALFYTAAATTEQSGSGDYSGHFRPNVDPPGLAQIRRAYGTDRNAVDSNYTFGDAGTTYGDLTAGDDINLRHTETGTTITFTAFTDLANVVPPVENDDGIGTDVAKIDMQTNGSITETELAGDLRVGWINSTASDVTLFSPHAIVDADGQPTIDMTGMNITMTAGAAGGQGGVGTANDFLEIDVAATDNATGKLTVVDITASAASAGVYVSEIGNTSAGGPDNLRVGNVRTNGDVSLATTRGSIIDANNDAAADVIGNNVDLNAVGGSIGDPSGGNDLDIDSSRWSMADVALQATASIFVNEMPDSAVGTPGPLNVILARALNGNVRLTVAETSAQGEDLNLLPCGTTAGRAACGYVFAEGQPKDTTNGAFTRGLIQATNGYALIRAGDNITTDGANGVVAADKDATRGATIRATQWIDLYGDFGNADLGYGTTMHLHGELWSGWSGALAWPGSITNSCASALAADPLTCNMTRVFGNNDADAIA